jgi:glycosyltransferase involved in cell wall biosynthesis
MYDASDEPLVSVGIPIFNGEKRIELVLNEICTQTYRNLEIFVMDNASTDRTAEIVKNAARYDDRIKYYRNPKNIGATANFSNCIEKSTGEFFMWAADDDSHKTQFIENCVKQMQLHPKAILCQTEVSVVLEDSNLEIFRTNLNSFVDKNDAVTRYRETLYNFPAVAIYGLYRMDLIRSSGGFRKIVGGDLLWIHNISLLGDFIDAPGCDFIYRARSEWNSFAKDTQNLDNRSRNVSKLLIIRSIFTIVELLGTIKNAELDFKQKISLFSTLIRYVNYRASLTLLRRSIKILKKRNLESRCLIKRYRKFLANPNIFIVNSDLYEKRVIQSSIESL